MNRITGYFIVSHKSTESEGQTGRPDYLYGLKRIENDRKGGNG